MIKHPCGNCGKSFNYKSEYARHINKKNPCISPEDSILYKYNLLKTQNEELISANNKLKEKNEELLDDKKLLEYEKKDLTEKLFNLEIETRDLKLKLVKNKNKGLRLSNKNSNNTNSHNNITNNNNNIKIVIKPIEFGKQDDSFIDKTGSRKILNKGYDSIQEYIKMVHFNKDKPEYHNVYMPNWRDKKTVLVYESDKWILRDRDSVIQEMKDNGIDFIQKKYGELDEDDEKDAIIINKINKFLKTYNDEGNVPYLDDDLMFILYNNRDVIEKLKNH